MPLNKEAKPIYMYKEDLALNNLQKVRPQIQAKKFDNDWLILFNGTITTITI